MRRLLYLMLLVLGFHVALAQAADRYPVRPVTLVIPFEAGGTTDIIGRLVAEQMSKALGVSVVVENRGGSGGTVGTASVARAAADGYTLLLATAGTSSINPNMRTVPYDPVKGFAPISQVADTTVLVVANPKLGVSSLGELVKLSKGEPGRINFASAGNGSISHLTGELFNQLTGASMTHIPYRGAGPAMADVLAGRVPVFMNNMPSFLPLVKSGALRPLAVASDHRSALLPEVPTSAEQGVPGLVVSGWFGVVAPAGTPPEVVRTLHAALRKMEDSPEAKRKMSDAGSEIHTSASPEAFGQFMAAELSRWKSVVTKANLHVD
jgi:tripartite-type tricarboxylate transporter receptor subunit TctC